MSYSAQPFPITLVYTDADFRTNFPYFANTATYPEAQLQNFFNMGTQFVSNFNWGRMTNAARQTALYLLTAHLQQMFTDIVADNGAAPGVVTDAQIDKIRVQIQPPPGKTAFSYWLNQTTWGKQLLALLSVQSAGGFYKSGVPQLAGFRNSFGGFG
jgi:hypothetical protein